MKGKIVICTLLIAALGLAVMGCSSFPGIKETTTETTKQIVVAGETYVTIKKGETFYCMRLKDRFIMFKSSQARTVTADDDGLLPELEEGKIARVTADLEVVMSDFGFYPIVGTKITKLTSVEDVDFEDITSRFQIPHADAEDRNNWSQLFQYTKDGKLYLIILYSDSVAAYTKDGRFIIYDRERDEGCFDKFFKAVGK